MRKGKALSIEEKPNVRIALRGYGTLFLHRQVVEIDREAQASKRART